MQKETKLQTNLEKLTTEKFSKCVLETVKGGRKRWEPTYETPEKSDYHEYED